MTGDTTSNVTIWVIDLNSPLHQCLEEQADSVAGGTRPEPQEGATVSDRHATT